MNATKVMTKTVENIGDIYADNKEAYQYVDLSYAYWLLAGATPTSKILKSFDTGILKSVKALDDQILADGLVHARVQVFGGKGKFYELFPNPDENGRIRAFYLIVDRTINGRHTLDLLRKYDFNSREEVIKYLPELYTEEAKPKLKLEKPGSIREIVKTINEAMKNR